MAVGGATGALSLWRLTRRPFVRTASGTALFTLFVGLAALCVAGCGSGSSPASSGQRTATVPLKRGESAFSAHRLYGKRRGGTLTVYSSEDFTHLDPAEADSPLDEAIMEATQRPLLSYLPDSARQLEPNLATAVPTLANRGITDGGRTVTVHIRAGVRFGPPVDRVVTSADVAYAIERGANPHVSSPWFRPYFGDLVGAADARGGPIAGIETPNRTTLVLRLTRPTGSLLVDALTLPLSAPVPKSFAARLDRHDPTNYGVLAEVATGPYMLKADRRTGVFAGVGYVAGRALTLVRNPEWSRRAYSGTLHPPAYLNRIDVLIGAAPLVIGPRVLQGTDSVQLDPPAPSVVQQAYSGYPSQISFTAGSAVSFGGLDARTAPFDNVWVRRAVWAAIDRQAIVAASGGPLLARPLTQFLAPGTAGFSRAGGYAGPGYAWNRDIDGNLTLAHALMRRAGYPSGDVTTSTPIDEVADDDGDAPAVAKIVQTALQNLGFTVQLTLVDPGVQAVRYCGVADAEVAVCPSGGSTRLFDDPASLLLTSFDAGIAAGAASIAGTPGTAGTSGSGSGAASGSGSGAASGAGAVGDPDWGQFDDPAVDAAMIRAETISDPTRAARAWAGIDRRLVRDAAAIPETFDVEAAIRSRDVAAVPDVWNGGTWDLAFTSLQNP